VTASTDLNASSADPVVGSADDGPAQEIADQMADVAGAMFALLLLQAPEQPVHPEVPQLPVAEPADAPWCLPRPQCRCPCRRSLSWPSRRRARRGTYAGRCGHPGHRPAYVFADARPGPAAGARAGR
jgi:hypothetical protein